MSEENISVEELEEMLKELEKRQAEKEVIAVVPQPQVLQQSITTAVSEEKQPSFEELARQFEELANRLELVEKAMTKGLCYHVRLPFSKEEEYATVCRYNFDDYYHFHSVDEQTVKLLTDLLFKYYKYAAASLQAIDELEECDSYPTNYHVVMFTDPVRLAVLYQKDAELVYVFKMLEGEYPEIIRITVDIGDTSKPRLRTICRVTSDHDIEAVKANLLEALDMPLQLGDSGGA
jgi:DNA-binding Lrp family transcriptional regulator